MPAAKYPQRIARIDGQLAVVAAAVRAMIGVLPPDKYQEFREELDAQLLGLHAVLLAQAGADSDDALRGFETTKNYLLSEDAAPKA